MCRGFRGSEKKFSEVGSVWSSEGQKEGELGYKDDLLLKWTEYTEKLLQVFIELSVLYYIYFTRPSIYKRFDIDLLTQSKKTWNIDCQEEVLPWLAGEVDEPPDRPYQLASRHRPLHPTSSRFRKRWDP